MAAQLLSFRETCMSCPIKNNRPRKHNLSPEQIRVCKAAKLHNYRHNTLKIGPVPAQAARVWHPSTALPRVAVLMEAVAQSQVTDEVTRRITTATNHRDH